MTSPPPPPQSNDEIACPGCGGRNAPNALECDWCGRLFSTPGRRLRLVGWQIVSSLLLLAVFGAVVLLGVLNAGRPVGPTRVSAAPTAPTSITPTPAVTARVVVSPTTTPRPTVAPAEFEPPPIATPTPPPAQRARVANTEGQGVIVRAEPGSEAARASTLREGAVVTLTGREQTVAARLWREVIDESRDIRGWVLADLLEPEP